MLIFVFGLLPAEAKIDYDQKDSLWIAIYNGSSPARLFIMSKTGDVASLETLNDSAETPLGSLWKLFVYIYLTDNQITLEPYRCKGIHPDEIFCCKLDGNIQMDEALYRSCGLFFDPARLGITSHAWKDYWTKKAKVDFIWLNEINELKPDKLVCVKDLLTALHKLNKLKLALSKTHSVLSRVLIEGTAKGTIRYLGGTVKIKTFTWNHPNKKTNLSEDLLAG